MKAALVSLALLVGAIAPKQPVKLSDADVSLMNEVNRSIAQGADWLRAQQLEDGSWGSHTALTALAVTALSGDPRGSRPETRQAIERGVKYILGCVKPSGGIFQDNLETYNTSIAMMALMTVDRDKYKDVIEKARRRLIELQYDEGEGATPASGDYGGFGYEAEGRPDMSNLQFALEALWMSEKPAVETGAQKLEAGEGTSGLHWEKAIKFLERCQNVRASNDQPWAGDDGGFIYRPGESKAGGTKSYGMTYAGLKSFIYAKVSRSDPRVQAAFNWIRNNYTVAENPGLGAQGLYYYYHTMAKALDVYGLEVIIDSGGVNHKWRDELLAKLVSLQKEDGCWVNDNARWWENNRALATSYTLLAMELASSVYR